MKAQYWLLGVALAVAGVSADLTARAQDDGVDEETGRPPSPDELQAMYAAHLAANAAALANRPTDAPSPSVDAPLECATGYVFWQRDPLTPLCQPLCASDADCGPNDGRCRIVDGSDRSPAPPMLLVDDMPADEVARVTESGDPDELPVLVCDPFFDVVGATDADAVGVSL